MPSTGASKPRGRLAHEHPQAQEQLPSEALRVLQEDGGTSVRADLQHFSAAAARCVALAGRSSTDTSSESQERQLQLELQEYYRRVVTVLTVGGDDTAGRLLRDSAFSQALLSIIAANLRRPLSYGSHATEWFHLTQRIFVLSCGGLVEDGNAPESCAFARKLLRMQSLHACSRQLAEAADRLQQALSVAPASAAEPNATSSSGSALKIALAGSARSLLLAVRMLTVHAAAARVLSSKFDTGDDVDDSDDAGGGAGVGGGDSNPPAASAANAPPVRPYWLDYALELAAALRDSCCLEHAARLALLRLTAAGEAHGSSELARRARSHLSSDFQLGGAAGVLLATVELSFLAHRCTEAAELKAAGPDLQAVLSGRCVRHLALSAAVAALCELDGGPDYGMPLGLRRGLAESGAAAEVTEASRTGLSAEVGPKDWLTALVLLSAFPGPWPEQPPGRRTALSLVLRTGRLGLAALRAWAGEEAPGAGAAADSSSTGGSVGGGAAAGAASRGATAMSAAATSTSAAATRTIGGAASDAAAASATAAVIAGVAGDPARIKGSLPTYDAAYLAALAAHYARRMLPPQRLGPVARQEADVECWRLTVGTARYLSLLPAEDDDNVTWNLARQLRKVDRLASLLSLGGDESGLTEPCTLWRGTLPASPPASMAAAMAAGLPGCMERLMRRAGLDPTGPEASVLAAACEQHGDREDCPLLPAALLTYAEPRHAAALVASLGKAHQLRLTRGAATEEFEPEPEVLRFLDQAPDWLEQVATAPLPSPPLQPQPPQQPQQAQDATNAPQPVAAVQQLSQMVSLAAASWLPLLSRLAVAEWRSAAEEAEEEEEDRPTGQAGGGDGGQAVEAVAASGGTTPLYESVLFRWTALLARLAAAEATGTPGSRSSGATTSPAALATGGGEWRSFLVCEMDAVKVLGYAMRVAPRLVASEEWGGAEVRDLAGGCCALAAACPTEVRRAAWEAVQEVPLLEGAAGPGSSATCDAEKAGDAATQPLLPPWHPLCVRALVSELRSAGDEAVATAAEALAAQLQDWGGGGVGGLGDSGGLQQLEELLPPTNTGALRLLATAPPSSVRRLLSRCSYPCCTNLEGDSEAALKLLSCAGCGAVHYCSRGCQTTHWREGHKVACTGRGRAARSN